MLKKRNDGVSLHIARRRHKQMRNAINKKCLGRILDNLIRCSLYLNEIRKNPPGSDFRCAATPKGCAPWTAHIKNLAANLERSPLIHSCGYGSADDRSTLFVRRVPAPHPYGADAQNRSRRFCAKFPLSFVPFMQHAG